MNKNFFDFLYNKNLNNNKKINKIKYKINKLHGSVYKTELQLKLTELQELQKMFTNKINILDKTNFSVILNQINNLINQTLCNINKHNLLEINNINDINLVNMLNNMHDIDINNKKLNYNYNYKFKPIISIKEPFELLLFKPNLNNIITLLINIQLMDLSKKINNKDCHITQYIFIIDNSIDEINEKIENMDELILLITKRINNIEEYYRYEFTITDPIKKLFNNNDDNELVEIYNIIQLDQKLYENNELSRIKDPLIYYNKLDTFIHNLYYEYINNKINEESLHNNKCTITKYNILIKNINNTNLLELDKIIKTLLIHYSILIQLKNNIYNKYNEIKIKMIQLISKQTYNSLEYIVDIEECINKLNLIIINIQSKIDIDNLNNELETIKYKLNIMSDFKNTSDMSIIIEYNNLKLDNIKKNINYLYDLVYNVINFINKQINIENFKNILNTIFTNYLNNILLYLIKYIKNEFKMNTNINFSELYRLNNISDYEEKKQGFLYKLLLTFLNINNNKIDDTLIINNNQYIDILFIYFYKTLNNNNIIKLIKLFNNNLLINEDINITDYDKQIKLLNYYPNLFNKIKHYKILYLKNNIIFTDNFNKMMKHLIKKIDIYEYIYQIFINQQGCNKTNKLYIYNSKLRDYYNTRNIFLIKYKELNIIINKFNLLYFQLYNHQLFITHKIKSLLLKYNYKIFNNISRESISYYLNIINIIETHIIKNNIKNNVYLYFFNYHFITIKILKNFLTNMFNNWHSEDNDLNKNKFNITKLITIDNTNIILNGFFLLNICKDMLDSYYITINK
jgi:hypothetical protein